MRTMVSPEMIEAIARQVATEVVTRIGFRVEVVESLPATGQNGILYLVAKEDSEEGDVYDEFVWIYSSSSYEHLGTTQVDLTNYVTLDGEQTITASKSIKDADLRFENSSASGGTKWVLEQDIYGRYLISRIYNNQKSTIWILDGTLLRPYNSNSNDIGATNSKLKDIYINGKLSNGTDEVTIAELASLITYAKSQGWIS